MMLCCASEALSSLTALMTSDKDPCDPFIEGQQQGKTENSLTALMSWNVLEAAGKKGPFK